MSLADSAEAEVVEAVGREVRQPFGLDALTCSGGAVDNDRHRGNLGARFTQRLHRRQHAAARSRRVFDSQHPPAGHIRALDPPLEAMSLAGLPDDERVERASPGSGRMQHRRRNRIGAERQPADCFVLQACSQFEHDLANQRSCNAVQRYPAKVDVVVRLQAGRQHDPALDYGLGDDLLAKVLPCAHGRRAYGTLAVVRPGTVVLAHGPLDPPDWWETVAAELRDQDHHVLLPQATPGPAPFAVGWVAGMARPLHATEVPTPLVLVGRGTAGPLLPALARTQRAARRMVGGYVFVDASLPRPGQQCHLDLLRAADSAAADRIHAVLHEDGGTPPEPSLATDHAFWTEPLPAAVDWPDAPCAYIRSGADVPEIGPTTWWARSAEQRGWLVDDTPRELGGAITDVIGRLAG